MPTPNPHAKRAFLLGFSGALLAVVGFLAFAHVGQALSVENVGGTLDLGNADLKETIINIVKWALGLLGLVAVIVMLYGGFLWMTARGNQQQLDRAKRTLINGAIGLVIILVSWAIVLFIQRFITNATNNASASAQCFMDQPTQWGYCYLCDDSLDPDPNEGVLVPDPSCITPQSSTYYADWQNPVHEQQDISLCSSVSAHFTGLTPASANIINAGASTFPVRDGGGNSPANTMNFFGSTAVFDHPSEDFQPNTTYTVDVSGVISSDNTAATPPPGGWTFTTGTTSDEDPPTVLLTAPTHAEVIQCLSPVIEVRFNEPMHVASVYNPANFKIEPADDAVARIEMPRPDHIQLVLDKPLVKNRTYTVTLSADTEPNATNGLYSGYKDSCLNALDCGNGMGTCASNSTQNDSPADDYRWQFTTADTDTVDCTPAITSVTTPAYHGNPTNPQRMTVRGSNFGISPRVRFNGNVLATDLTGTNSLCFDDVNVPQRTGSPACINTSTSAQIDTMVPTGPLTYAPNGAMTGPVTVEVAGISSAPSSNVEVRSPHITGIYPTQGKAGRFVTLFGQNFGAAGQVRFRIPGGSSILADTPSCSTTPWTDTQILVQVPEGFNINDTTFIQVDTNTYADVRGVSNLARFDIKDESGPNLCSITPTSSNDPLAFLDAVGDGFGTTPAQVQVRYSSAAGTLVSLTDDKNLRAAPTTALANGIYNFFVTVNGVPSNPLQYRIPRDPAPEVVRDSSCSTSVPIIRSPNPLADEVNTCRNQAITARFTEVMNPGAAGGTTDPTLFVVQRCNNNATFDATTCSGTVNGTRTASTYSKTNDTTRFAPAGNAFSDGYWYRVTLRAGIRSAANVPLAQDVTWQFRVRESGGDCQATAVGVTPPVLGPLATGQNGVFTAIATNSTCATLLGLPGDFNWSSSNTALASDPAESTVPVGSLPADNTGTTIVQAGTLDGEADIIATYNSLTGSGRLVVQRNYCETNTDCATRTNSFGDVCTGAICNIALRTCEPRVLTLQSGAQTGPFVNGPAGNLINVRGCYFGAGAGANGKVTFTNGGNVGDGSFAMCGPAGWTNDLIRVETRPTNNPPAGPNTVWNVQVIADSTLTSNNDRTYTISDQCSTPTGGNTAVPASGMPILCGVLPPAGREGQQVQYQGGRFSAGGQAFFSRAGGPLNQLPLPGTSTTVNPPSAATSNVAVNTGIPAGGTTASTTFGSASGADFCIATPVPFSMSCNVNSECNTTGCCQNNQCQPTSSCTNGLILSITPGAGTLACRNQNFVVTFVKPMRPETVTSNTVYLYNTATPAIKVPTSFSFDGTTVAFSPNAALPNGTYRIKILGGPTGVTATDNTFLTADYDWPVPAGAYTVDATSRVCALASVRILDIPPQVPIASDLFTCNGDTCSGDEHGGLAGNQHAYRVAAYDSQGNELGLASQAWVEGDATAGSYSPGIGGPFCPTNLTSNWFCATARNVPEGSEVLTANVTATQNAGAGSASIDIQAYMCANPWPAPAAWPFRDPTIGAESSHNFTFHFCRDKEVNNFSLSNIIPSPASGDIRKEYIMTVLDQSGNSAGDAIGVRVVSNMEDLSPVRWYNRTFDPDTTGTTSLVDGYPALKEGRTVYVTATNYRESSQLDYPNVYVVSHTPNARPETVAIFNQVVANLRFNNHIAALPQTRMANMRTDLKRIHAMSEIVYGLRDYAVANGGGYPKLETGTFLKNYSFTSWPSWQQELGRALGIAMPQDPENKWDPRATPRQAPALCTSGFDPNTCWNETTKVMQFPSRPQTPPDSTGFAYRHQTLPSGPLVALFSTMSATFPSHISSFTGTAAGCLSQNLGLIPPSLNICPSGSTCQGYTFGLCSGEFSAVASYRNPPPSDVIQPTISGVTPVSGSRISGIVPFVITATDNAGGSGIGRIELVLRRSNGTEVARTTLTVPNQDGKYTWSWDSRTVLNNPGYALGVTAFDRAGNRRDLTPSPTYIVDNPPGDPTPPVVTPTSPNANGYVFTGSDVTLTASATDVGTGVSHVDFYLGSSRLGQAPATACTSSCPASYSASITVPAATISAFPNGSYTYSVVAYDAYGNSAIRQLSVTKQQSLETIPPTVSFIAPTAASGISGTTANVIADANDASGISYVRFFVGTEGTPRTTDIAPPYTYSWPLTGYVDGQTYTIRAEARDMYGNINSATLNVVYRASAQTDLTRPQITNLVVKTTACQDNNPGIPMNGASVEQLVHLCATFTDNVAMQRAELRIDGVYMPLTGAMYTAANAPYTYVMDYPWNTIPESLGNHTVAISAYDTSNNVATVSQIVNVSNGVTLRITAPLPNATVSDNPTVPVTINVTRTCDGTNRLPQIFLGLEGNPNSFATISNCNGTCTYNWSTRNTSPNGQVTLWAIGHDAQTPAWCWGGNKVNLVVNNSTSDTTAPTIDATLTYDGMPWAGPGPYYVTRTGTIVATARDENGGSGLAEVRIEVRQGANTVLSRTCSTAPQSPCQLTWNAPQDGSYTVVVSASDTAGNDAAQVQKTINVDATPPQATWVSPASGTTVSSPATLTLQANGTDPQVNGYASGINRIEYYNGANRLASNILSAIGTYQIIAQVFDNANNMAATSPAVTLTINGADTTPPTVSIIDPANDNWYWSGTKSVSASAADGGSGVRDVQFYIDGAPLGALDTAPAYWTDWNTTLYANGQTVSLTARACDNAGNCTTSAPRLARAWNGAGTICRTNICSGGTPNCCSGVCQSNACAQQTPPAQ